MHIGHTRYTSTLFDINIQYAHNFITPTFYKNKMKHVYDNTVCSGKLAWCFFVNCNVFFSQHLLN